MKHESESFEHQTMDEPEQDHCGIDKFTHKIIHSHQREEKSKRGKPHATPPTIKL